MKRLIEKARELADELLQSEEFRAYQEAEIDLLNDDGAQELINRLYECEARLRAFDYASKEECQRLVDEVRELRATIEAHPAYARYQNARRQFDRLVGLVIDTISFGITGLQRQDVGCGSGGCGCGSGLDLPAAARRQRLESLAG